jgi:peptidoglycan/LPS O-acetylase OafA/YrhL
VADTPRPVLDRQPALDGLRGLAVAAVVAFHLEHLRGGFLGVDLFFVLSGFLITSLLLVEFDGRSAIDLGRFWSRRARRLLPALFLLLSGVALLMAVRALGRSPGFRGDALSTLGYVANWHAMARDIGYWDMFAQPSPLDHMWSLAIEEQFYLLWPPLVLGLLMLARRRAGRGRRLVGSVAVAGAVASFAVLALTWTAADTSRAYYGTDARVGPTLLGAALAALVAADRRRLAVPTDETIREGGTGRPRRTGGWWAPAAGMAALAFLGWSFATVRGTEPAYYRGGLAAFALAAVVVVAVVARGRAGPLGAVLGFAPLRWLGIISYGVYLWHWPVIVYATPERTGLDGWVLDAACVAVTLALAIASFVLVERPIRRGALRSGIRGVPAPVALGGAIAAVAVLVVVATVRVPTSSDVTVVAGPARDAADYPAQSVPESVPRSVPSRNPRILLVGDSGPIFLGPALTAEAQRDGAEAAYDSQFGCTPMVPEGKIRFGEKIVDLPICHDARRHTWAGLVDRFDPDVVVYYLAAITGLGHVRMGGAWVGDCDPAYDAYLRVTLTQDADVLGARGATVVFTTTPPSAISTLSEEGRTALDCRDATYRAVAAHRPHTELLDLRTEVQRGVDAAEANMWRDPIHLSDYGAAWVSRWMVPACVALVDPQRLSES